MRPYGMYPLGPATPSLLWHEPLLGGALAPAGTIFVLGENGGYAATPAPTNRLVLGRNSEDVHVTIGARDWYVSREHATMHGEGSADKFSWRLRNNGRLPIRIPDVPQVLQDHEIALPYGYTPLYIRGSHRHVVEVLITDGRRADTAAWVATGTHDMSWSLTDRERLVLVAMFQDYLFRADEAHPLSWKETSRELNGVPGEGGWNARKAENVVDSLRHKLAKAGTQGITADSAHPEEIKRNLLRHLLDTATLVPVDLLLLDTGIAGKKS